MRLPGLEEQGLYLDVGWSLVAAAFGVNLAGSIARRLKHAAGPVALTIVALLAAGAMWLPAPWSPSFWLGMAFQHPSLLLVILAGLHLVRTLGGRAIDPLPLLPVGPAATVCVLGVGLYAGSFAWVPFDPYGFGYWGYSGAVIASLLAPLWYALDRRNALACVALALAALVHAVTRLPSGNAWDAVLDPLLFLWAAGAALAALIRFVRRRAAGRTTPAAFLSEGQS